MGEFPLMANATTNRHLSATVLLSRGLTPGKLRGLQRISNPNGTLTMLALDQNSSMIDMAQKAPNGRGQDREPTYQEIANPNPNTMPQTPPTPPAAFIDPHSH